MSALSDLGGLSYESLEHFLTWSFPQRLSASSADIYVSYYGTWKLGSERLEGFRTCNIYVSSFGSCTAKLRKL
jgi:hypothetical protein